MVYGVTGSGKTTAAARLSGITGVDWYAVDDLTWQPGWVPVADDKQRAIITDLCERDEWIIDHGYGKWLDIPLDSADLIIALDYPRWVSFSRLLHRSVSRVITGELQCNGNRETWRTLLAGDSILVWHFQSFSRKRRRIRVWAERSPGPSVLRFSSQRQLDNWLRTLRERER